MSRKIHAVADALANPTAIRLTTGQAHDLDGADALLPGIKAAIVIADKGYDAKERMILPLEKTGKRAVMPSRSNSANPRNYDRRLYKARHLVENFFVNKTVSGHRHPL